jgi:hypothetical protein
MNTAVDLQWWRKQTATVKPLTLFADPAMAPTLEHWKKFISNGLDDFPSAADLVLADLFIKLLPDEQSTILAGTIPRIPMGPSELSPERRSGWFIHTSTEVLDNWRFPKKEGTPFEITTPDNRVFKTLYPMRPTNSMEPLRQSAIARNENELFIGWPDRLSENISESVLSSPNLSKDPAWACWDMSILLGELARHQSLLEKMWGKNYLDLRLGPNWSSVQPIIRSKVDVNDGLIHAETTIEGWQGLALASLLMSVIPNAVDAAWFKNLSRQQLRPTKVAYPSNALLWSTLSLEPENLQWLLQLSQRVNLQKSRFLPKLLQGWQGEVVLSVQPGPILPHITLALKRDPGAAIITQEELTAFMHDLGVPPIYTFRLFAPQKQSTQTDDSQEDYWQDLWLISSAIERPKAHQQSETAGFALSANLGEISRLGITIMKQMTLLRNPKRSLQQRHNIIVS